MPGISSRGDPASESAQPGDGAETQAGSPPSVPQSRKAQPRPGPPADAGNGQPGNRLFRKKVVTPIVLAFTGVALGLIAYAVYPSRTQLPVPTYTTLHLTSDVTIDTLTYRVYQVHPSTAEVKVSVLVSPNTALPAPGSQPPSLTVFLPIGMTCPQSPCFRQKGGNNGWYQVLTFHRSIGPGSLPNESSAGIYAFADFTVKAKVFGVTSDGATASAAIPKLHYTGPGSPTLITQYQIPSANKYDWSTFPPAFSSSSEAQWLEQMNGNSVLFDVDAAGTNHIAETRDSDLTFLAGVLLGVGGGALVAAGQEALHIKD